MVKLCFKSGIIGVASIFRGWVRQGRIQNFWLGDDGGAEGPERGAKRRSVEGGGFGELPGMGSGG